MVDYGAGAGNIPPFASAVAALRASLAETAARFPTLAGRIVHLPATGDAAVDCAGGGGVRFVVAESGDAVAGRLAGAEDHDAEALRSLAPALDAGQLPAETMAAQVTRLRGGLALGVAMHHAVVDGRSVWRFVEAWAAACRGDADGAEPPTFDRAAIELPGGEDLARVVLRKYAPDLPMVGHTNLLYLRLPQLHFILPSALVAHARRPPVADRRAVVKQHGCVRSCTKPMTTAHRRATKKIRPNHWDGLHPDHSSTMVLSLAKMFSGRTVVTVFN